MQQLTMTIGSMTCGGCVKKVTRALGTLPGVRIDTIEPGTATVSYDPAQVSAPTIIEAVEEVGFPVNDGGAAAPHCAM